MLKLPACSSASNYTMTFKYKPTLDDVHFYSRRLELKGPKFGFSVGLSLNIIRETAFKFCFVFNSRPYSLDSKPRVGLREQPEGWCKTRLTLAQVMAPADAVAADAAATEVGRCRLTASVRSRVESTYGFSAWNSNSTWAATPRAPWTWPPLWGPRQGRVHVAVHAFRHM